MIIITKVPTSPQMPTILLLLSILWSTNVAWVPLIYLAFQFLAVVLASKLSNNISTAHTLPDLANFFSPCHLKILFQNLMRLLLLLLSGNAAGMLLVLLAVGFSNMMHGCTQNQV
jgi:hypothetical protein